MSLLSRSRGNPLIDHAIDRHVVRLRATGIGLATILILSSFSGAYAQPRAEEATDFTPYSYADIADLAGSATVIAIVRPRSFAKVDPARSEALSGTQRYYVDAQVDALIRGDAGMPSRIAFLLDIPADEKPGRTLKGKRMVVFGRSGARPGEFQLLSNKAILPSTPATDARVHAITTELVAANAPPQIARVVEAFHVEGTVAGESETQIFLTTRNSQPVSLSVVRRPDMEPRFGAALGEIVDEAADLPKRDTLLWYRLACGLPSALPATATAKLDAPGAQAAARDYRSFMERLGTCTRTRPPVLGKAGIEG